MKVALHKTIAVCGPCQAQVRLTSSVERAKARLRWWGWVELEMSVWRCPECKTPGDQMTAEAYTKSKEQAQAQPPRSEKPTHPMTPPHTTED